MDVTLQLRTGARVVEVKFRSELRDMLEYFVGVAFEAGACVVAGFGATAFDLTYEHGGTCRCGTSVTAG
eukprot:933598-Prorocentrum_lima.AAC.1